MNNHNNNGTMWLMMFPCLFLVGIILVGSNVSVPTYGWVIFGVVLVFSIAFLSFRKAKSKDREFRGALNNNDVSSSESSVRSLEKQMDKGHRGGCCH